MERRTSLHPNVDLFERIDVVKRLVDRSAELDPDVPSGERERERERESACGSIGMVVM